MEHADTVAASRDRLIRRALERTNWDLLVCISPANVLLLTGYWPAVGASLAVATRDGRIALIVPEDEIDIAERSWADELATYTPTPLHRITTPEDAIFEALLQVWLELKVTADRLGFEQGESFEAAAYGPSLPRLGAGRLLRRLFPAATLAPADELLAEMRSVKTKAEIDHIGAASRIMGRAFEQAARLVRPGMTEAEMATAFRMPLGVCLGQFETLHRCDGVTYCMSGENAAKAYGPYPRSRSRRIENGDLVIVHCDFHANGYWAAATRTYQMGRAPDRDRQLIAAVLAARAAALSSIRPGVRASDVDRSVRALLEAEGLGSAFKHSAGHGAGFGPTDHTARPRLHPQSEDILQPGMVMKLEAGAYLEHSGARNADMILVTGDGPVILTDFHWNLEELVLHQRAG